MQKKINSIYNNQNIFDVVRILPDDFDCFIYWGSLLNIGRHILHGVNIGDDDDVDFMCDITHKEDVEKILTSSGFSVRLDYGCFLQVTRTMEGIPTYVDFYFFKNDPDKPYLSDSCNRPGSHPEVRHPKKLLLPLDKKIVSLPIKENETAQVELKIPFKLEEVCAYMYGEQWATPHEKNKYRWGVVNFNPKIVTL